jgi:hypothetical protein
VFPYLLLHLLSDLFFADLQDHDLPHQRIRTSLLACRLAEGQRSRGTVRIMKSKTLAHCCAVSMVGEESGENPLSLASLRSRVLVRIGRRTWPTVFSPPSNARHTRARK